MNIGQVFENFLPYFDYICPMVLSIALWIRILGYENPAAHPYEVIKYSLDKAQERIDQFKEKQTVGDTSQNIKVAVLRPWLQNFDPGALLANASMIIKEKEAVLWFAMP